MTFYIRKKDRFLLFATLALSVILTSVSQIITAQEVATDDPIQPPGQEAFVASDSVAIPWRVSDMGCRTGTVYPTQNCRLINNAEFDKADILTLYNLDGTQWYRFSLSSKSPDYFHTNTKMHFKPFALWGFQDYPHALVLRLIGESDHWYEVEVNEKTRATKYILKSDPMWVKTTWSFLFGWSYNVVVDQNRIKLLDKPDGEVIKETADAFFNKLKFVKLDGDWMYVGGIGSAKWPFTRRYGWIRWRKGRDILVGSRLNGDKIPEPVPD